MADSLLRHRAAAPVITPPRRSSLTASAEMITSLTAPSQLYNNTAVEDELWGFYYAIGEYGSFVDWMARAMSRVRLLAAEQMPGGDEPAPITEGPAAELAQDFYGGTSQQAFFMQAIVPQLLVPGQSWLVAQRTDPSVPLILAQWSVESSKTFQVSGTGQRRIQVAPGRWETLLPDALATRIWQPDPVYSYMPKSPAISTLPIMRRLDLVDKRILSELLSRLVMNGMLWLPEQLELPSSPEYADQADPFFAELIDIASRNISTPGSALAAIPFPVKVDGDWIDKIKHMEFAKPFDEQLLIERDKEIARLATSLPLSAERQQGFAEANHWNGFLINDDDVKISIAPLAEIIANGATTGYMQPMLAVAGAPLVGPNGGRIVMWPDYSELAVQPDKSKLATDLYDRGEISGDALRRESGMDESDKPDDVQQREMILLKAARLPATFASAFEVLTGESVPAPVKVTDNITSPAGDLPSVGPATGGAPSAPSADGSPAGDASSPPAAASAPPPASVASGKSGELIAFETLRHRVAASGQR